MATRNVRLQLEVLPEEISLPPSTSMGARSSIPRFDLDTGPVRPGNVINFSIFDWRDYHGLLLSEGGTDWWIHPLVIETRAGYQKVYQPTHHGESQYTIQKKGETIWAVMTDPLDHEAPAGITGSVELKFTRPGIDLDFRLDNNEIVPTQAPDLRPESLFRWRADHNSTRHPQPQRRGGCQGASDRGIVPVANQGHFT